MSLSALTKSKRLSEGAQALDDLDPVGRTEYEGGDGGTDVTWHNTYRVWPANGATKADVHDACENHAGEGYVLMHSSTGDEHEYVYVTVEVQEDT